MKSIFLSPYLIYLVTGSGERSSFALRGHYFLASFYPESKAKTDPQTVRYDLAAEFHAIRSRAALLQGDRLVQRLDQDFAVFHLLGRLHCPTVENWSISSAPCF
jgi:excinuclease UvrABC helicase subunit UvrB